MTQEAKLKVVCFFAHPDDEAFGSGGTLAELVLKGHHVTTVCATNGDVGEISDPSLATRENLWKVRQNELRSAMEITGVPDVRFLGYRDSGMDGTEDNNNPASLYQSEPADVENRITSIINELKPNLILTHDPTGGYGHPDHLTVHRRVTSVVNSMNSDRPYLYYVCFPKSNFRKLWQQMTDAGITPPFAKEQLENIGSPDDYVTTVRDVSNYVDVKKASLNCHQTQLDPTGPFSKMAPESLSEWMSTEYFYLTTPSSKASQHDILLNLS